jgi:DNA repair exonuclease SbcCD ATPase subunit
MTYCEFCQIPGEGGRCPLCGDILDWEEFLYIERQEREIEKHYWDEYSTYVEELLREEEEENGMVP